MIALCDRYGIAFVGVPKCGTKAMLHVLYELQNGRTFEEAEASPYIHKYYRARMEEAGIRVEPPELERLPDHWCFTILRDPVARLLSAYAHRVVKQREIARDWQASPPGRRERLANAGLKPQPGPEEFFARLEDYRTFFTTIRHHTNPVERFLGPDLDRYDFVGRLEDMDRVAEVIGGHVGRQVAIRARHAVPAAARFDDLPTPIRRSVLDFVAPDYAFLDRYYAMPAS